MANRWTMLDCTSLATRTSFASYVTELNATTAFDPALLEDCKGNICSTLWGNGNADISGIGVSEIYSAPFLSRSI